jgi:translin
MKGMQDVRAVEIKLLELQKRKDTVLALSRDIVRIAGKGITLMHARKLGEAVRCVAQLEKLVKKLKKAEGGLEYYSMQAHQEYVEARAFYTVVKERRLLRFSEAHVNEVPYLLGMMDLVGELKREIIEAIREKEMGDANLYYQFMKEIYDSTRAMRFANSVVPEFRRKQDSARIQLENAASELLSAKG